MALPQVPPFVCPFCGGPRTVQCRCKRGDMECSNGHEWHYKEDEIHAGSSDHGSPICCSGPAIAMVGVPRMVRTASLADRVAARYQNKKKVKTKDGDEMVVYEYSDRQVANRNKAKAKKVEKLKSSIHHLRSKVKKDLKPSDPEKMLTALAVALMDHTFERVGNFESAGEGHFGVTGWQKKHITFGKKTKIKYVGKSGVEHDKEITDATIKKALRDAYEAVEDDDAEILSWEGGKVTPEKVNAYLKDFDVTAKDLRGFHANDQMVSALKAARKAGGKLPEEKKAKEKQLKEEFKKALEETADAVGHEASTLRSQYLVPDLETHFIETGEVPTNFAKIGTLGMSLVERVVRSYSTYEVPCGSG